MNILITQISRMGALCWIKCLKRITNIEIFIYGTDINDKGFSAGSQLVNYFINIPLLPTSKEYVSKIFELCCNLKIDLLLSAVDDEIKLFLNSKYNFSKFMCNLDYDCFTLFNNKYDSTKK